MTGGKSAGRPTCTTDMVSCQCNQGKRIGALQLAAVQQSDARMLQTRWMISLFSQLHLQSPFKKRAWDGV